MRQMTFSQTTAGSKSLVLYRLTQSVDNGNPLDGEATVKIYVDDRASPIYQGSLADRNTEFDIAPVPEPSTFTLFAPAGWCV